jgi:predicted MPP superfamily phosphohydrolase
MGLKLLHISDIHFQAYDEHSYLDLDKDIQGEVELDLKDLKAHYGEIDIILIGGDIAFSGKEAEYKLADEWIKKICSITGCAEENVLTVPGNHDIDRDKLSAIVRDVHEQFKKLRNRSDIDRKVEKYVTDPESAKALLSPLNNYEAFAQKYGSNPTGDNILFWEKDFKLDNSILRIRGVNSALVSDEKDDENTSKLFLGSSQCDLKRSEGTIYIFLCHHPPQWLYDGDEVQKDLKPRARLQLFGHKHSFSTELVANSSLVLAAGAMQPSRTETGWEPRYNIIELAVPSIMQVPTLNIKIYKRVWNKNDKKFKAEYVEDGSIFEEYNLKLNEHEILDNVSIEKEVPKELTITPMAQPVINLSTPDPKRRLAFMFLDLPYHARIAIAVQLGLVEDSDREIDEIKKAHAFFKRAAERDLLAELWDRVCKFTGKNLPNPFKK